MNITWEFNKFNMYETYNGMPDVVYSYNYSVTVTDGTSSASQHGFVRLNFDVIADYVPFASLTKETVQQWTEATIDTQKIIQNLKEAVLAKDANTKQGITAPWIQET